MACVSAVTYGMIPLFALPVKQSGFSFDTALFYRFLFSALIIWGYFRIRKVKMTVPRSSMGLLVLLGLLYALSAHFLFMGYDYMSAGVASTILFMYPVFVAVIMGVWFHEKLTRAMWIAIALALFGVGVLNGTGGNGGINPTGMVAVLLSALTYALYIVIVNKSSAARVDGAVVSFYSMLICSGFFLLRAVARDAFSPAMNLGMAGNLLLFALIPTVISLITLVEAVKHIGSTPTAVMGSLEPVTAVLVSVAVFHEQFTARLFFGILLIVAAVMLTVLSDYALKGVYWLRDNCVRLPEIIRSVPQWWKRVRNTGFDLFK